MIRTMSIATRAALIGTLMMSGATFAQQSDGAARAYTKTVEGGDFDDVAFAVEQAITNEGLVIDSISHVGEMLARTKGDVGGAKDLYLAADTYSFCSAIVSRQAMEADIANIQFCPSRRVSVASSDLISKAVGIRGITCLITMDRIRAELPTA